MSRRPRYALILGLAVAGLVAGEEARAVAIAQAEAAATLTLTGCAPSCGGVGLTVLGETIEPLAPDPSDGVTTTGSGTASTAGSARTPGPGGPVVLTPGDVVSLMSMADARAVPAGSGDAFFFSAGLVELVNGGAASVVVTVQLDVSSRAVASVDDSAFERAFAVSDLDIELIDAAGAIESLVNMLLVADTDSGGAGGSFADSLTRTVVLAPGDGALFHIAIADAEANAAADPLPLPVPEPASLALLAAAVFGLGVTTRRSRRRSCLR